MNDHSTNRTSPEDDLFEFAANPANPTTGLEHTVSQAHRALAAGSHAMPESIRQKIREELMPSPTVSRTAFASASPATMNAAPARRDRRANAPRSRLMDAIARWQPVVSMTIVVALLASVIALTYQRGVLDDPDGSGTFGAFAEDATPESGTACTPPGPLLRTPAELEAMNLGYWTAPEYTADRFATPEEGQAVVDAFEGWEQCIIAQVTTQDIGEDVFMSYYSPRRQYLELAPTFAESRDEEIQAFETRVDAVEEIIFNMPLPIGVPDTFGFDGERFAPQQVYHLTDGRFAVIVSPLLAPITLASLLDPASIDPSSNLRFLAYMEINGKMYLDETQVLCVSDVADALTGNLEAPASRCSLPPQSGQSATTGSR